MTLGQLLSKRDEFWDTAPAFNGRPEIWQALRAAAECGDNDTAQAIMSAVDVTLPHGNLSLVYDELGNKYDIPPYCLSEPANLVKNDSSRLPSSGPSAQGPSAPPDASEPADAAAPALRVRLRLSTNQQVEWSGAASTNVATLKQFIQAEHGIGSSTGFKMGPKTAQRSKDISLFLRVGLIGFCVNRKKSLLIKTTTP